MRSSWIRSSMVLLGGLLAALAAPALEAGSKAPDFVLQGSDGQSYALSQFLGKGGVVLAWFPKAFTPG